VPSCFSIQFNSEKIETIRDLSWVALLLRQFVNVLSFLQVDDREDYIRHLPAIAHDSYAVVTDVLQEDTLAGFDRVFFAIAESTEFCHKTIRPLVFMSSLADWVYVIAVTAAAKNLPVRAGVIKTLSEEHKDLNSSSLHSSRIFLLSPANLGGVRAGYVMAENAESDLSGRLRREGVTLGEVFSFISGLYFRGKLAYARAFSSPPSGVCGCYVITAGGGLVPPETVVNLNLLREFAVNAIDPCNEHYRAPLDRDCGSLSETLGNSCEIVLLGSIATPKYVEPLLQIFRERLVFPMDFVGRGDMSRGGLMLRCVEAGRELDYTPILTATRRGSRPPKLSPLVVNPRKLRQDSKNGVTDRP
jgi:hypothetical protein